MSSSHECPFCKSILKQSEGFIDRKQNIQMSWNHYSCHEPSCINDDMPRYSINFRQDIDKQDGEKTSCTIMIDSYYIQIDWEENVSILSTLEGPLLLGSITLPRALDLDMSNLESVVERIKTLLVFS